MAKVAFLLPNLGTGGAERVAIGLMNRFREAGHQVEFVLMQAEGALLDGVPSDVRVVELAAPRVRQAIRPLIRYFRESRPDAVQARMWPLTVAAIIARRLARSPARLVVSDHAIASDHLSSGTHRLVRATMRLFYPMSDARVTVSRGAVRDLASLSGLPEACFSVIHNPIAFPSEVERSATVEALWQGRSKRILTIGQLKAEKNQAFLIHAFANLPAEQNAGLMIVGAGPLEVELKRLSRELGVEARVIFAGHAPDPWPFYASADLFVLGSREESFGNVLVEALYAGLPIVSTDNTGAREVLDDGRFGALVRHGNINGFAAAIEKALGLSADREALRRRAEELSGEHAVASYFELLLTSRT
jgi:glycosyltransferase involved in cell wall biosynthesis